MSVSCECCVLSGRVLCVGLIIRPEESYRVWWWSVCSECDCEAPIIRRLWPTPGRCAVDKKVHLNVLSIADTKRGQ